jgi:hypothetical protein
MDNSPSAREKLMQTLTIAINIVVLLRVAWALLGDVARPIWRAMVGPPE